MKLIHHLLVFACLLLPVAARAVNLLPNSSFELGYNRGWNSYDTGPNAAWGNLESGAGLITNAVTGFPHGLRAIRVPTSSRLLSTTLRLTNGTYTISGYGLSAAGTVNLPYGFMNKIALDVGANPAHTAALNSASWTRFSASTTLSDTNTEFWLRFGFVNGTVWIDGIQIEPGGTMTAYAPQSPVEVAPTIPGTNNMTFSGDTPTANLNFWNEGDIQNIQVSYDVFNAWNSNILSVRIFPSVDPGATVVPIALPEQFGWFRLVTRLATVNESDDEMTYTHYPYASNITTRARSWLGRHPHISEHYSRRERLAYADTARNLSPNFLATRWSNLQPQTNTQFNFFNVTYTNWANEGLDIVACLTGEDGWWQGSPGNGPGGITVNWATNSDGSASMSFWSNYCWMVVNRVAVTLGLTNTYFEVGPNEPRQSGPIGDTDMYPGINVADSEEGLDYTGTNLPINVRVATNYARVLMHAVRGITNAYANARIIGIGGAFGDGSWAYKVWTNVNQETRDAISVISTHQYPDDNNGDPNVGHFQEYVTTRHQPWIQTFRPEGVELWNTESGTYGQGSVLGRNGFHPIAYYLHWIPTYEAERAHWHNRQLVSIARIIPQALRCIGFGFDRYFYYDARYFNDGYFDTIVPYVSDYLQVDHPFGVALSCAASIVHRGFGPITNVSGAGFPYLEMYAFTNASGQPVIGAWSADRVNKTLTFTNSNYELLDVYGNRLATNTLTAAVNRIPRYFRSTTLTLAQLSNTLANASVVNIADTTPPEISINIAPIGLWHGDTNLVLIHWTPIDDTYTAWPTAMSATNVTSSWRLDNGSWSVYSASNHVLIPGLSAGNHTFYVRAADAAGNISEKSYGFIQSASALTVRQNLRSDAISVGQ